MAGEAKSMTRSELEALIASKAWDDPKYKAELLANPKAVLQREVHAVDPSIHLPDAVKVHVHQESKSELHIVLPRDPHEGGSSHATHDHKHPQTVGALRIG